MSDSGSSSGHVSEMPPHKRRKISTSDDVTPPGLHLQEPDPYDHLHRSMFGSVNELGESRDRDYCVKVNINTFPPPGK